MTLTSPGIIAVVMLYLGFYSFFVTSLKWQWQLQYPTPRRLSWMLAYDLLNIGSIASAALALVVIMRHGLICESRHLLGTRHSIGTQHLLVQTTWTSCIYRGPGVSSRPGAYSTIYGSWLNKCHNCIRNCSRYGVTSRPICLNHVTK